jgi:hypothetical protein
MKKKLPKKRIGSKKKKKLDKTPSIRFDNIPDNCKIEIHIYGGQATNGTPGEHKVICHSSGGGSAGGGGGSGASSAMGGGPGSGIPTINTYKV